MSHLAPEDLKHFAKNISYICYTKLCKVTTEFSDRQIRQLDFPLHNPPEKLQQVDLPLNARRLFKKSICKL